MKTWRMQISIFLFIVLLFNTVNVVTPQAIAQSASTSTTLSLPNDLTDWLLDEASGYIYAVSSPDNNLYFIRLSDFTIEVTLPIGSNPSFIEKDGQLLHIALSGATLIKTVDLMTKQVVNTITTTGIPHSIAASSDYLYYSTNDNKVYKYDKATYKSSELFNARLANKFTIAIDESTNTLYVGEVSSYGGIIALNAQTGDKLSEDIDDRMEIGGPSLSLKRIFIDDSYVYFGGHQFNKHNLVETTGTYFRTNDNYTYLESVILSVTDSYVLTTQGVYDKATYLPLALFPSDNKRFALLDTNGNAYIAGISNWYDNLREVTKLKLTIPQSKTASLITESYYVTSDEEITQWTSSDSSPYIYAIISSTNELIVINKDSMSEVKRMFIGSNPSGIKVYDNKIYVMFNGENHINVISLDNGMPTDTAMVKITTKNYPLDIYPDKNNRILYNGGLFNSGVSVTSDTYTTVTDAVYNERKTGIAFHTKYILDQDNNLFYAAGSVDISAYNSQSYELLARQSIKNINYSSHFILDEGSLYLGNTRFDANHPSLQYGTYPENIIYARGNLVFSQNTVYDRDSFTKSLNMMMDISSVFIDANETIFVSTNNRIYKFDSFSEMQIKIKETRLPTNFFYVDENIESKKLGGILYFTPPKDSSGIEGYSAYYLNQSNEKLQELHITRDNDLSTESLIVYKISNSFIPEEAVSIGLFVKQRYGNYSSFTLDTQLRVPIYDAPDYFPLDFTITNRNTDINKFDGNITWKPGVYELPNVRYYIYFIDEYGPITDNELAVVNGGLEQYTVSILDTIVPEEALGIGIVMGNDDFTPPFFSYGLFDHKLTPPIQVSSITVYKYRVQHDSIVVNNLSPGDLIRVYDESGDYLYGYGVVKENQNSITISINNIGNPGNKLLVTRHSENKVESIGTVVVIPPVINDGGVPGGGIPGGGIPGGGIPGGGIPGGGIPGGGFPGGAIPGGLIPTSILETVLVENSDGTSTSLTKVTMSYISQLVNDDEFKRIPIVLIKEDEEIETQSSQFQIDANAIQVIFNNSKDATITFKSAAGEIGIPIHILQDAISSYEVGIAQQIVITMSQASSSYETTLKRQLQGSSNLSLGVPIEFHVELTGTGKDVIISNTTDYVEHKFKFNVGSADGKHYAGLTYDEITQSFVPIPTIWEWKDGVLHVTLKRKGNSVYTVVQTDVKLNDVTNQNPYRESILELAGKMVINGYPDGSFKADELVTRAEFAAMLNRALGILPKVKGNKTFNDITNEDAWYTPQINAAVDAGLINGYTDGSFRPDQHITHQEMIVMLVNGLQYGEASLKLEDKASLQFPDKLPAWAKPHYAYAVEKGILSTNSPFLFETGKKTERQESAYLLHQLMKALKLTNSN